MAKLEETEIAQLEALTRVYDFATYPDLERQFHDAIAANDSDKAEAYARRCLAMYNAAASLSEAYAEQLGALTTDFGKPVN